jgi:uncharacterized membrane protein YbhN (UPF0104 family)
LTAVAKKFFSYFLKVAILVLAFAFIYHQYLKKGDNLKQFEIAVNRLSHQHVVVIMSVVVALMFANWLVECLKWQHLTRRLAPISLWKAIEGVFCGLTWAVFTPNRRHVNVFMAYLLWQLAHLDKMLLPTFWVQALCCGFATRF